MDSINEVIRQSAAKGDVSTKYLTFQIAGQLGQGLELDDLNHMGD